MFIIEPAQASLSLVSVVFAQHAVHVREGKKNSLPLRVSLVMLKTAMRDPITPVAQASISTILV